MAERNSTEGEDAQTNDLHSDQKATMKTVSAFRRRAPLTFSPKRQYAVAVISPMQKHDSSEPVFADVASLGTSSSDPGRRMDEAIAGLQRRYRDGRRGSFRSKPLTRFKPFSFDARDAAQRVKRERKLREISRKQHQWLARCSTFKAHPIRRYKPMVQPSTHSKGALES
ncbi:siaz-interacting nuclear protein isoform X1 [Misgurnus anguillicaudatus]|uniref:siaz-interacting nuclear protein isoform X1 n=1 Tax=Misgurnus anguillicaudatus TaxID=75329 RepID=UPI003CCFA120